MLSYHTVTWEEKVGNLAIFFFFLDHRWMDELLLDRRVFWADSLSAIWPSVRLYAQGEINNHLNGTSKLFYCLKLFTTHLIAYILGHEACQGGTDKWLPTEEHYLSPRRDLVFQKVAGITRGLWTYDGALSASELLLFCELYVVLLRPFLLSTCETVNEFPSLFQLKHSGGLYNKTCQGKA